MSQTSLWEGLRCTGYVKIWLKRIRRHSEMWKIILVGLFLIIFSIATPVSSLIMVPGLLFIIYGLYKIIIRKKA